MFNINSVPLPDYSRKEDIINSVTHGIGVPYCAIALYLLLKLQINGNAPAINLFATIIYLVPTLLVFLNSAIYHGIRPGKIKKIARLVDHSGIYFMISGTITALVLPNLNENNKVKAIVLMSVVWIVSFIGIALAFIDLKKFNTIQIISYVVLGWSAGFGVQEILAYGDPGKTFILTICVGGFFTTTGAILYFVGKKRRYFHAVFHVFSIIGNIFIFIGTYNFHSFLWN